MADIITWINTTAKQ